jgi:Zn-dependent oligopeptidase
MPKHTFNERIRSFFSSVRATDGKAMSRAQAQTVSKRANNFMNEAEKDSAVRNVLKRLRDGFSAFTKGLSGDRARTVELSPKTKELLGLALLDETPAPAKTKAPTKPKAPPSKKKPLAGKKKG